MSSHEHGCVAHSFGELTLSSHGLKLLIDATWLYRDPENPRRAARSPGWSVIAREPLLREWNRKHHTDGVRLPTMLTHPRFTIVVHHDREALTAGAVLHDTGIAVGLSNTWSDDELDGERPARGRRGCSSPASRWSPTTQTPGPSWMPVSSCWGERVWER